MKPVSARHRCPSEVIRDEPDPRPFPDPQIAQGLLYDSFDALAAMMSGKADTPTCILLPLGAASRRYKSRSERPSGVWK